MVETSSGDYTRTLYCDGPSYYCSPIVISRQRFIFYSHYKFQIKMNNLGELASKGLLRDGIEARFEYTNEMYTQFSTYLRMVFAVMSAVLTIFYVIYLFVRQDWTHCKLEQKWIIVLFLALILYNNPVYFLDYVGVNFVFPFLNIAFTATFASLFLLFVMIMTNAFIVKPRDRGFWFYFPKLLLVGILWISVIVALMWERLNQSTNGAYDLSDLPFYAVFSWILSCVFGVCVLMTGYYVVRAFSESYQKKFKYFAFVTLIVIAATLVDYVTFFLLNNQYPAQWLSFYPIYNYYMIIVAMLFMPSNVIEDDLQEKIKEMSENGMKGHDDLMAQFDEKPLELPPASKENFSLE